MLRTHTLVSQTVAYPVDDHPIFDSTELSILRRFCANPAIKEQLLKDVDMLDQPGEKLGTGAGRKGSLAGTLVSRAGTEEDFLEKNEWESLKDWFAVAKAE